MRLKFARSATTTSSWLELSSRSENNLNTSRMCSQVDLNCLNWTFKEETLFRTPEKCMPFVSTRALRPKSASIQKSRRTNSLQLNDHSTSTKLYSEKKYQLHSFFSFFLHRYLILFVLILLIEMIVRFVMDWFHTKKKSDICKFQHGVFFHPWLWVLQGNWPLPLQVATTNVSNV